MPTTFDLIVALALGGMTALLHKFTDNGVKNPGMLSTFVVFMGVVLFLLTMFSLDVLFPCVQQAFTEECS